MPFLGAVLLLVAASTYLLLIWTCVRRQHTIEQLEQQLRQQQEVILSSERQQELMFSANPHPMWIYDRETLRFVDVNDAAVKQYGYSRQEFLEMTVADIRPATDREAFLQVVREPLKGQTRAGVWRHQRKDGSIIFVEILAFQFSEHERSEEMVLALDVTERYRMEEALRESQASLKMLVDYAPFGVAQTVAGEDHMRSANPAFLQMLGGYSLDEALRLSISKDIYADPAERDRLLEVLQRSGTVQGWETNFRTRAGGLVPVRITGSASTPHDDAPGLYSIYVEDLTQQSKLEQQVRQVQKLEAVGRLAGGMAHDFNNVLVVIKLSTEMMLGQITPDSQLSKPLLQVSHAADRAAALTRQMLAFGRQQIMLPRIINLNTVVSETTHMLRRVIGEDIALLTNLGEDIENSRLDPDQVTQIILNLAVNARDAMPNGGALHIETANVDLDEAFAQEHPPVQPGRFVMLAVSDTGTGMDKSVLPRIFDPFFTTKEIGKGTGLGLSIVYGIVKQSGGYIWVYSEPGHGTSFKIYFPATKARLERPPVHPEGLGQTSGQLILLVEDERSIRANVRDCLQQLGYRVVDAENGRKALELCKELDGHIDLLLTDLVMAGKSGHQLARELVALYPNVRVLFMSGYTEDSAARRDILLRGSQFLQKPFSVADLTKAVNDALTATHALA